MPGCATELSTPAPSVCNAQWHSKLEMLLAKICPSRRCPDSAGTAPGSAVGMVAAGTAYSAPPAWRGQSVTTVPSLATSITARLRSASGFRRPQRSGQRQHLRHQLLDNRRPRRAHRRHQRHSRQCRNNLRRRCYGYGLVLNSCSGGFIATAPGVGDRDELQTARYACSNVVSKPHHASPVRAHPAPARSWLGPIIGANGEWR